MLSFGAKLQGDSFGQLFGDGVFDEPRLVLDLTIYNIISLLLRLGFTFEGERKFGVAKLLIYIFSVELEAV